MLIRETKLTLKGKNNYVIDNFKYLAYQLFSHREIQINKPICYFIKGRVQSFSMQVVINKCFLLNPEKKLAQIRLIVF